MDLKGAVAVVTGAARGLGKAIAQAYAAAGARVALVDILGEELGKTAAEMKAAGAVVLPVATDVTVPAHVDAMAAKVESELGRVDILVNNAGTFSVIAPVWEADPEKWFRDVRVSLYGSFLCCRAIVGGMVERKSGYVINMSSSGPLNDPHAYSTSYAAAKVGVMRLTEGLAKEVREHGVKVFACSPGTVLTEMTRFIMNDPGGKQWRPGFHRMFDESRGVPPERMARLAVELVSGRADALSGRFIDVKHDFEEMIAQTDEILENDLLTLRIRR